MTGPTLFGDGDLAPETPDAQTPDAQTPGAPEPDADQRDAPLAARLRPRSLDELVGQAHLVGEGGALRAMLTGGRVRSVLLWGPPGTGKTSIARVIAASTSAAFVELSAVTAGVRDVRAVIETARERRRRGGATVLFLDEIHRFNRSQQDALLPAVEDGLVALVGATTENPSFEVNPPLRSRSILLRLHELGPDDVRRLVERAISDPRGLPGTTLEPGVADLLARLAGGDARIALTTLEAAAGLAGDRPVSAGDVEAALAAPVLRSDKSGDAHYDQLSAFIKSLRGSDADAAVYWLVRLLTAGEDPRLLARRMVILASEDVGLADPSALGVAVAAFSALERVGLPEARFALVQAALHLALAPKSNSVTRALAAADAAVARLGPAPVPAHLRDAHYRGAAALGHGVGYRYPHDDPRGWVEQSYGPEPIGGVQSSTGGTRGLGPAGLRPGEIYSPGSHGAEPSLAAWIAERRRGGGDQ